MKLYLSSFLLGDKKEHFAEAAKALGGRVLVVADAIDHIPDSPKKAEITKGRLGELTELGLEYEFLDLREWFGKQEELFARLRDERVFYVMGGNTFVLRRAMFLSGFDRFLLDSREREDILYGGFSAGICVLAETMEGLQECDDPEPDPHGLGYAIWEGVGLLPFMPIPHFDSPDHPESPLMFGMRDYMEQHALPYRTLRDGDVITGHIKNGEFKEFGF